MTALVSVGVIIVYLVVGTITARLVYVHDVADLRDDIQIDWPIAFIPILAWPVFLVASITWFLVLRPVRILVDTFITAPTRKEREEGEREEAEKLAREHGLPMLKERS